MSVLARVDALAHGPFLVAGTPPPEGRDLDVLAAPAVLDSLAAGLDGAGFHRRRTTWARFGPLELVDLGELRDADMLERGEPLEGCVHARRPDPADALRLTARSVADDGRLTAGRRSRADVPSEVWEQARRRGDAGALDALRAALDDAAATPALVTRLAGRVRRVREAGVVAISGLDGSGKSTQARMLTETLTRAGFDVAVEWNRVSHDAWLDRLARPVKRLLRRGGSDAAPDAGSATSGEQAPPGGRQLWVLVVALANAWAHFLSVRRHIAAGRIVICDRYVLDSVVHLRAHYPPGPGRTLGIAAVRLLSPRPRAAFYLSLEPRAAMARKEEPWSLERVTRQAEGYDTTSSDLAVRRLDATRAIDDLAAEIATESWRRL
jgi:thymidylate kinase